MIRALSWVVFGAVVVGGSYAYFNGDALCRSATGRGLLESWWRAVFPRRERGFTRIRDQAISTPKLSTYAVRSSRFGDTGDSAETVLWV